MNPHYREFHASTAQPSLAQGSTRIVSYNIRKAIGLDRRRDPDRIANVLEEVGADIVVLQEADRRMGTRAGVLSPVRLEKLGYWIAPLAMRPESHGWHGNAILVRVGQDISEAIRINLPMLEARGAVLVYLPALDLFVVGVHLGLTPGMRRRQMSTLKAIVSDLPAAIVIAGDFNVRGPSLSPLSEVCEVVTPGPSFHSALPRIAFDRFAIRGPVTVERTFVHRSILSSRASDHLPVVMDFTQP